MVDPEAESAALKERSAELVQLLDASHPLVAGIPALWAERRARAAVTHQARQDAAAKDAAGIDNPGVTIGARPALRRVRTDWRGNDLDPFHGAACITPQLTAFWEWTRDVFGPAYGDQYLEAAQRTPYRPALVSCARAHVALLQQRASMLSENGVEVETALARYDQAYENLRQGPLDAQAIVGEAVERLAALQRISAEAVLGDEPKVSGFIASSISAAVPDAAIMFDDTAVPVKPAQTLVPANAKT
jgi:hypothetical protein